MNLMRKNVLLGGIFAVALVLVMPRFALAEEVCTCTYTRTSVSSDATSSENTYELSTYDGTTINSSSTCLLGCSDWADGQTVDSGGALIYTITETSYAESSTSDSSSTSTTTSSKLLTPVLSIDIPDLIFSDAILSEKGGRTYISVNYLGEYIAAVYKYLLGIATTIAIVMIMISGLQWTFGGQSKEAAEKAATRMKNAVTGLVLLLCTYLILFTVNPNLLKLQFPELQIIEADGLYENEDDVVSGNVATSLGTPSSSNVYGNAKSLVPTELVEDIETVAKKMESQGYGMTITDGYRSVKEQETQIALKCKNPPGSARCDPKDGKTVACILKDNNPANCPHTTGRALDIWGTELGSESQCITRSQCSPSAGANDPCRLNECQAALITAMREQGFCNLSIEAWHFEKPPMSTTCN